MRGVGGIILCGGYSRRMGRDKATLPFGAETLLRRTVRVVCQAVDPVVVVAAAGQSLPPLPRNVMTTHDAVEGRGPLQGLAAGLQMLVGKRELAFICSCDLPFLQADLIRRLIELCDGYRACVPSIDGMRHPLAAVYRTDILADVEMLLASNGLSLQELLHELNPRLVTAADLETAAALESLFNVNTPEQYQAALDRLARSEFVDGREKVGRDPEKN